MRLFSINECGTLALLILCVFRNTVEAWYIAPPRINSEWEQLAGLVVDCFEAPPCEAVATDRIAWRLFQRTLSKKQTYRQFVRTARKMKGKKYSILIAKEGSRVIGMVELGINVNAIISENYNNTVTESANRRATIGVVCVEEQYQRMGIASALIKSCKLIVADQWQESVLYAEVEFTNAKALEFFELAGFTPLPPDWGGQQVVMV